MRTFWIAIVLGIWLILGYLMCQSYDTCCTSPETNTKNVNAAPSEINKFVPESGPLLFNWGSPDPITNADWAARKQSLLDDLDEDEKLRITGRYFGDEENTSEYADMGLARAHMIKEKLFPGLSDDQVELRSLISAQREGAKENPFRSADFDFAVFKETVKEIAGKSVVQFPFNSTNQIEDADIEIYLSDLADRLKSTSERVKVTGHTCDIGGETANRQLGLWRAERVRDFLIQKGIPASRISISSDGESNPMVPNTSEANRRQNRRAEIEIVQ